MIKHVLTDNKGCLNFDEKTSMNYNIEYDKILEKNQKIKKIYMIFKRILDVIFSLSALVLLCPIFLIIVCCIKIDSKGPAFFKQKRIGKNKKEFYIIKFRTMTVDTPQYIPTHMLNKSNNYITKVGRFLRGSSLDELPQFINILKGDMALIGPRPALYNQYDLINERDRYRVNEIKPGLTGWAQVNGRDKLTTKAKARLDGEYYIKYGILIDLKCFFKTFYTVIMRDGYVEGAENVKMETSNDEVKRRSINETSTDGINGSIDDRAI
ncbi:sugar transferase [Lachnobacterium bovis]|uniref:O-antigen biosynthesis protein WbqP n=1 Tax=Lachnobacterium bovis TaxID=140626 RepID=A0A1H9PG38_9FIRM|nr:sugar transferase [Lachnobacterium bovis]SER47060.1 O-antigen biosynthesis protein WbqP [Lachnobacterium bovis]